MKTLGFILDLISGTWSLIFKIAIVIIVIVGVVSFIKSCANNATLNEHSSCQQFEQADTTTQNKVLQDMIAAHHDQSSTSTALFSVTLYCNFHDQNAPIDGVYNSSNADQQPVQALHIPAPLTTQVYSSQVGSKTAA